MIYVFRRCDTFTSRSIVPSRAHQRTDAPLYYYEAIDKEMAFVHDMFTTICKTLSF
jgi:hypothetical protein